MMGEEPMQSLYTKIVDHLRNSKQLEKVSTGFGHLKSDKERVAYVLKLPCVHEEIDIKPSLKQKSSGESASLRNEGNTFFQRKLLHKALEAYTQSILTAPLSDAKTLALAYANRSAVLFHLKKYELCLGDIEVALEYKYPDEILYKLIDRKARCLKLLGEIQVAVASFKDALVSLKLSNLKKKDTDSWQKQLEKQIKECISHDNENQVSRRTNPLDAARTGFSPPVQSYGRNSQFISASTAFEIKVTQAKGRHPVATRDVDVGDVLLIEKPYASVLLPEYSKSHCHHCFSCITAPVPCQSCAAVRFCSATCASESWDAYHSIECKYLEHIHFAGKYGHLALRVVVKSGLDFLKNTVSKLKAEALKGSRNDTQLLGCNENSIYDPAEYRPIYHLVGHTKERSVNDLFLRTVNAVFLLKCIQGTDYFSNASRLNDQGKSPSNDQLSFIGGLLLRHLQSLPCNAHEISELQLSLKSVATSETTEIGAGIYATLSLFNHSCDPNVTRFFYGDKCVVRAFRTIQAGTEISDNYGILSALTLRDQRQTRLHSQYYFKCECHACEQDLPLYSEIIHMETPFLKCGNCGSALAGLITGSGKLVVCEKCKSMQDLEGKASTLRKSEQVFNDAMTKLLQDANVSSALPQLEGHLRVLEECVCHPWQGYNSTQELIKQCYNILANCHVVD